MKQEITHTGELEELMESFDWKTVFYDPLHDTIEASSEKEKEELKRMEDLIDSLQELYIRCKYVRPLVKEMVGRYWDGNPMEAQLDILFSDKLLNQKIMNEKNLEYLKDNIKYQGFGETLNPELENQLKKGMAEFSLSFKTEVNKKNLEATLHFKKSDNTGMYFFNKYDVRAQLEKKDETIAQTFYLNKGHGVTLKEAYNLLNGRAVHKELTDKQDQKFQAWIQLDFNTKDTNGNYERKQYHENYGYDLKETLSYYPIKEMNNDTDSKNLVRSLEKGNVQMVTLDTPGKEIKVFIEANPQYKSINLYNNKMQRLDKEQRQELMQKPDIKEQEKIQKSELSPEKKTEKNHSKVNKKAGVDDGLIQKKRVNNKKGLSI